MSLVQLSSDAIRLVSHMQPPDPRPLSPLPSDDGNSSVASRPPSSQDPYYSNDDIAALHAVVVAAQDILDSAPEPKPLPAAALFNAYDAILPNYGIDPDSDHHISAFIFRIGGEGGDGSLVDKFQAILGRMGIILEFGDNTTESPQPSFSTSSPHVSFERQGHDNQRPSSSRIENEDSEQPQQHVRPPIAEPPHVDQEIHVPSQLDQDEDEIRIRAHRAALSTILGRWRTQALGRRQQLLHETIEESPEEAVYASSHPNQNNANLQAQIEPEPEAGEAEVSGRLPNGLENEAGKEDTMTTVKTQQDSLRSLLHPPLSNSNSQTLPPEQAQRHNTPTASHPEETIIQEQNPVDQYAARSPMEASFHSASQAHELASPQEVKEMATEPGYEQQELTEQMSDQHEKGPRPSTPVQLPRELDTVELQARQQKVMRQAERARELYLASKVFNHWADRTARRLERDAVARRHMIRFRYFQAWTQAPVLKEQTIDNMRLTSVVKKWQRVGTQDDDLVHIAEEIAAVYRLESIHRILNQWSCHRLQHVSRGVIASRSRNRALSNWMSQSSADMALSETIEVQSKLRREQDVLMKWRSHASKDAAQAYTSQRVAIIQQTFDHIRNWWDQTEIERRAVAYRHRLLIKTARSAFHQWNIQARAQAFVWRREYVSVTRVFDKWCRRSEQMKQLQRNADNCYEGYARSKVLQCVRRQEAESSQMTYLENRACLYIRGTLLLKVFEKGIKQQKDRDKQYVKRYLMARFTQVSSTRKKRNFFAALDKWSESVAIDETLAQQAYDLKISNESRQHLAVLQSWSSKAKLDQRELYEARFQHGRNWLEVWKAHSIYLDGQDMEAWQLWASERQRNCLKEWSIASLQQSGQAHTASEVRKKHDRQKRNRYAQQWRQLGDRLRPDNGPFRTSTMFPQGSYRGSWRALSGRRSVIRRSDKIPDYSANAMETPTRWTGQPTVVSSILPASSMAPVREADEDEASSTTAEDVGMAISPSKKAQDRRANRFFLLSSTTPRAPVPLHLERGFHENDDDSILGENENIQRSSQQRRSNRASQSITTTIPTQTESVRTEHYEPPPSLLRPSAPVKPFGSRAMGEKPAGMQPGSQSLSRAQVGKPVSSKPSGLRYGISQSSKPIPSARSVRIRSPKSFTVTTPRPLNHNAIS